MTNNVREIKIEDCKGFEIYKQIRHVSTFVVIYKNGERYGTSMYLISLKAARNVIDTYLRSQNK